VSIPPLVDASGDAPPVLQSVWAQATDDAWIVGTGGTILHWDGKRWSAQASGTTNDLSGVWEGKMGDVWVVGAGTILRH
jgi:hypothetical protein